MHKIKLGAPHRSTVHDTISVIVDYSAFRLAEFHCYHINCKCQTGIVMDIFTLKNNGRKKGHPKEVNGVMNLLIMAS